MSETGVGGDFEGKVDQDLLFGFRTNDSCVIKDALLLHVGSPGTQADWAVLTYPVDSIYGELAFVFASEVLCSPASHACVIFSFPGMPGGKGG